MVRCEDTRYQAKNEELAWIRLEEKLKLIFDNKEYEIEKNKRSDQIGGGERSDKRRTYRISDNLVIDHITGKRTRYTDFAKGKIELLK
jgi:protein subunit release factor A